MDDIIVLINEYSNNLKKADYNFYEMLRKILTRELDVSINSLIIINDDNKDDPLYKRYTSSFVSLFGCALYDTEKSDLVLYEKNIDYDIEEVIGEYNLDGRDYYYFYNLLALQTVLHEFEHVCQHKRHVSNEQDFESKLIRVLKGNNVETTLSYQYSLTERLADIKSYSYVIDLFQYLDTDSSSIYDFFSNGLKELYLKGYHFEDDKGFIIDDDSGIFMCPTDTYARLKKCDTSEYLDVCMFVRDEDRLLYGLPITLKEYKAISNVENLKI